MQVKKQQFELDKEQRAGSKLGKEYIKAIYCHSAYLTYMQSASCEMLGWMKHTGIKIAGRNVNNLRYADDTTLMAECEEKLKRLFSSSSLSAIRVVSSAYLRLLIFLLALLIPVCFIQPSISHDVLCIDFK